MTLKEKMHGEIAVVTFKGNIVGDPDTANIHEKVRSLMDEGITKIVFDLGKVHWVNSAGLGALIASLTTVKNRGGDLRLASVTEKVESLFAITQLVKVFKTYESVERAVASFKK
jgi:anti-sigma B factor antagonist